MEFGLSEGLEHDWLTWNQLGIDSVILSATKDLVAMSLKVLPCRRR